MDSGGMGGVAQGWVFIAGVALGFIHVGMVGGHAGMVRVSQNKSGWVGMRDSLTHL